MAYGLKYELFFSDVEKRKFKIEILQNGFVLDRFNTGVQPTKLVGTGSPAVIEWDSDDDIYSPIIGSRCILNLFITDASAYDEFYKAGEREYKVRILEYTSFGSDLDKEVNQWDLIDQVWEGKLGSEVYYNAIWEGFIVTDRYQEAIISTPYEIKLEAIDGLGTLNVFDAPFPTSNTNDKEKLFFYLKEILKLTGHEFDIYISNDIRKDGGATNDTIFHDIEVDRYIFSDKNLVLMDAKKALRLLLKMTNSRIFQSFGRWYVISNSNLIDNRIVQGTVAPSADDVVNEPDETLPTPPHSAPDVSIDGASTMYYNTGTNYRLIAVNSGSDVVKWTWNLPGGGTLVQTDTTSQFFGQYELGTVSSSEDGDSYTVTGEDANGNTDTSAAFVLNVEEQTTTPTQSQTGEVADDSPDANTPSELTNVSYDFRINANANFNVSNAYVSPHDAIISYGAAEAGDAFTTSFDVVSLTGEFTSASQITTASITGGHTVTKQLIGEFIRITVTGTLPVGGATESLFLTGAANVQQFTTSYTLSSSVSNSSNAPSPANLSVTGGEGESYSMNITYTAQSGYEWTGLGNIQVVASANIGQVISVDRESSSTMIIRISGAQGVADQSATITVTGAAVFATPATSITISPDGTQDVSESGGSFDVSITADGGFTVVTPNEWIHPSITQGATDTTFMRVDFDRNLRRNTRTGYIYLRPRGSSTNLATLTLTQESSIETQ